MKFSPAQTRLTLSVGAALSAALLFASWRGLVPYSLTEALGFVTGAACVYLVVRQSVWNFPLGIANNIFFLILFAGARLYGDAGLQLIYVALGVRGWHQWLRGGEHRTPLKVSSASPRTLAGAALFVAAGTALMVVALRMMKGAAPALDAFTTVLSLAAQYLLNRKLIENWYLWMTADVVYVYLYVSRGLHLTAVLYAVFLCLCVAGLVSWRRALAGAAGAPLSAGGGAANA
jgi:nicotinamide mononucleotide transporter